MKDKFACQVLKKEVIYRFGKEIYPDAKYWKIVSAHIFSNAFVLKTMLEVV